MHVYFQFCPWFLIHTSFPKVGVEPKLTLPDESCKFWSPSPHFITDCQTVFEKKSWLVSESWHCYRKRPGRMWSILSGHPCSIYKQTCLNSKVPMKTQNHRVQELSNHWPGKDFGSCAPREGMEALYPILHFISLHLLMFVWSFSINQKMCSFSWDLWAALANQLKQRRVCGKLHLQWVGQKHKLQPNGPAPSFQSYGIHQNPKPVALRLSPDRQCLNWFTLEHTHLLHTINLLPLVWETKPKYGKTQRSFAPNVVDWKQRYIIWYM